MTAPPAASRRRESGGKPPHSRKRKEGVYVEFKTPRSPLTRISEKAGERSTGGAASPRSEDETRDRSPRCRARAWLPELARAEGRSREAAGSGRQGILRSVRE